MLTEARHEKIISIIEANHSIGVQKLAEILDSSESTIRRDLNYLDKAGRLVKVRGGAMTSGSTFSTKDDDVALRQEQNRDEKLLIARYAASLIEPGDFVYLDAGTTTGSIIDFLEVKQVIFVTNAVDHARRLSRKGYLTYLLGGEYKYVTDAVIGEEAILNLEKYNFTKGFWGTNGANTVKGFSTPDIREAKLKESAMAHCLKRYVVCDSSKFSQISCVSFADFKSATVITSRLEGNVYSKYTNIVEVSKK